MGKLYDDYFGKPRVTKKGARVTKKPMTVTEIREAVRRGRPKKPNALTAAEKQRAYRERRKAAHADEVPDTDQAGVMRVTRSKFGVKID